MVRPRYAGPLGTGLQRWQWPDGWRAVAVGSADLDFTDTAAIVRQVLEHPWDVIINGAAYTVFDRAEGDIVTACNALGGPTAFAASCASKARTKSRGPLRADRCFLRTGVIS